MPLAVILEQEIPAKQDRGGIMRVLLSPRTVNTTSGFMGTLTLQTQGVYKKHYHPYSDEYLYVVRGEVNLTCDEVTEVVKAGSAVFIAKNIPHRLYNNGAEGCTMVFFSTPLAPRPELGHVLMED